MTYTRGNKNWLPCVCQWPVRRYSCYHNFAVYFIMISLTVRLPTHLEQTKSICAIICLYVKNCKMLEMVREVNKIINNFRGEHEVYNVDLFIFL
jgi:hypothetical protein